MANILDKYGIKEVCDITFYEINETTGKPGNPVLYIDTAKVSTLEQAAESVDATGGKGNVPLITWDYGRDITMTLEDALFSARSFEIMFGAKAGYPASTQTVIKTLAFTAAGSGTTVTGALGAIGAPTYWEGPDGTRHTISSEKVYDAKTGNEVEKSGTSYTVTVGEAYFVSFPVTVKNAITLDITSARFPGTYYVTADTYARSEKTGNDEFFQLIIPKAKVLSEDVSITMEAEGDPSTFQMNLKVLRNQQANQKGMVQLVKYDVETGTEASTTTEIWSYESGHFSAG